MCDADVKMMSSSLPPQKKRRVLPIAFFLTGAWHKSINHFRFIPCHKYTHTHTSVNTHTYGNVCGTYPLIHTSCSYLNFTNKKSKPSDNCSYLYDFFRSLALSLPFKYKHVHRFVWKMCIGIRACRNMF